MLLKSVEMFGFKSFPERTRLDFGPGVTGIVGPNGCGKSNISDAVRWVFGERSTKALRGKKMEDVIFSGTSDRAASGFAEVSLTLDNAGGDLGVDSDEVCVTRRVYRSGDSEYLINKKPVRLADLLEVFMDTGLGRDGYSLISQGQIGEIVSARSEDRREIFEEAAGISKHRYRREEAEKSLERANENMVRLTDIAGELEGRVEPLRIAAEKAEKYVELVNEKTGLELGVWLHELEKNDRDRRKYEQDRELVKAQLSECGIALGKAGREIELVFAQSQSCSVEIDNRRREQEELSRLSAQQSSGIELERGELAHREQEESRINGQIEQLRGLISGGRDSVKRDRLAIEEKEEACRRTQAEAAAREAELAALNLAENGAQRRAGELYAQVEAASQRLNEARIRGVELGAEITQMNGRVSEYTAELAENEPLLAELKEEAGLLAADAEKIEKDLTAARNSRDGSGMKLKLLQKEADESAARIGQLKIEVGDCLHKARTLEELEKQMEGYSGSVKAVIRFARGGGLKGICGVVGRLLTVPEKYSVAIEIALGGALQHIITETDEQAKYAMNYLKQTQQGRATFLPINAVNGDVLDAGAFAGCAGFIGGAVSLVGFSKEYTGIFRRLLGRTAVCEDLDSAIAAARKTSYRYKVVTLDGQVVNAGGSMTGGSVSRGAAVLSRANLIAEYRAKAQKLSRQLEEAERERAEKTSELEKAAAAQRRQEEAISGLAQEKVRNDLSASQTGKQLEAVGDLVRSRREALRTLKEGLEKSGRELEENRRLTEKAQSDYDSAGALSREYSQGRSEVFERREKLLEEISRLKLEIAENRKDIGVLEAGIRLAETDGAEKSAMIEKLSSALAESEETKKATAGKIAEAQAKIREYAESSAAVEKEIELIIAQRNTGEQRLAAAREQEKETNSLMAALTAQEARIEERLAAAQRSCDGTVSKLWDEYELTVDEARGKAAPIVNLAETTRALSKLREKIRSLGPINTAAPEEYREVSRRYSEMKTQLDDIETTRGKLGQLIKDLNGTMTEMFTETFEKINAEFGSVFTELFGGGRAELALEDPENVLDCGIAIKAQPPGKTIKNLESLSGGERAFLAIAIYFAILKVKPSPFCLLDEIEAALDDVNVVRYAEYMHSICDRTQFIVITHRHGTMEAADRLYGVTMRQQGQNSGVSKILQLPLDEMEKQLGMKM